MNDTQSKTTDTAKVFMSGTSQAVRLPQRYRFRCDTVKIKRQGKSIVLTPIPATWDDLRVAGKALSDDFVEATLNGEDLLPLEERESFD